MQTMETPFREVRESLFASREDIVRRTKSVSLSTVRNVELGKPVRRDTARQLLVAVNTLLSEAGKPTVTLDELGLTFN